MTIEQQLCSTGIISIAEALAYIVPMVSDIRNTTRYQRVMHLAKYYDLTVICMHPCEPPKELSSDATWVSYKGNRLLFPFWFLGYIKRQGIKYVVSCHLPLTILAGRLCRLILGCKWVADVYDDPALSSDLKKYPVIAYKALDSSVGFCLRDADHVMVTLAKGALSRYRINKNKISHFTNGTDVALHARIPPVSKINLGTVKVLYVGHVLRVRGVDLIIEAAKQCKNQSTELEWLLVGPSSDEDRAWLEDEIRIGELNNIHYVGLVPHQVALEYICDADICLCPFKSTLGTEYIYPVKIFEYMAFGKAIISTNLTGVRSVISHEENGILVEPDNAKMMADAVMSLASDKKLRKKLEKLSRKTADRYDWSRIHKDITECLEAAFEAR